MLNCIYSPINRPAWKARHFDSIFIWERDWFVLIVTASYLYYMTTRPNFSQPSRRNRVDLLLYESITTDKREQCDWGAEKNLDGYGAMAYERMTSYTFPPHNSNGKRQFIIERKKLNYVTKFFPTIQSHCSRLSAVFLSYNSRSTILQLDCRKKFWTGKLQIYEGN